MDPDGTILTANAALEAMFGWPPGSLVGQPFQCWCPTVRAGSYGRRRDGSSFPVELTINQVQTVVGQRAIGFVTDITERLRAGERLRESEQRQGWRSMRPRLARGAGTRPRTS
jgi:PAS domain-containing protein